MVSRVKTVSTQPMYDGEKFDLDGMEVQGLTVNHSGTKFPGWMYNHQGYTNYSKRSLLGKRLGLGKIDQGHYIPRKVLSFNNMMFMEIHNDDDYGYTGNTRKAETLFQVFWHNVAEGLLMKYPLKDIIGFSVFAIRTDKRCPRLLRMPKKHLPYG